MRQIEKTTDPGRTPLFPAIMAVAPRIEIADNLVPHVIDGYGSCKSCGCQGYVKGQKEGWCGNCGHAFSQHR